jgi:hypothetical protein
MPQDPADAVAQARWKAAANLDASATIDSFLSGVTNKVNICRAFW